MDIVKNSRNLINKIKNRTGMKFKNIFIFEGERKITVDELAEIHKPIMLPFGESAIVDPRDPIETLLTFSASEDKEIVMIKGVIIEDDVICMLRGFVAAINTNDDKIEKMLSRSKHRAMIVTYGQLKFYFFKIVTEDKNGSINMKELIVRKNAQGHEEEASEIMNVTCTAIAICYNFFRRFSTDNKLFAVELNRKVKIGKKRKIDPSKKLFRVMRSSKIRKEYIQSNGNGRKLKTGHERRRHLRTYRHQRYINMRGKTQVIAPVWIGPKEVKKGPEMIRVRLDVGAHTLKE